MKILDGPQTPGAKTTIRDSRCKMMETLLYMEANLLVIFYGLQTLLNLVVSLQ